MKKPLLLILALLSSASAQDRSIAELRRQIAQGYHQVNPRTQTQARSGNVEAQALLRYQQAQARANGDYNTGRTDALGADYARQRAALEYQAELNRIQRERELAEIRRYTEEARRLATELERRNASRR